MKTLIIYNVVGDIEDTKYAILEGDYTHLDNTYINICEDEDKQNEACALIFEEETGNTKDFLVADKTLLINKEWDDVAHIVFVY